MPFTSPGRGGRVVADTEIQTSGWCSRMSAATLPLPTAVGPARTTRRLRDAGRVPASGTELLLECGDLFGAEPAAPAALGDPEPLHRLPGADLAEAGHRLQQVDDPH